MPIADHPADHHRSPCDAAALAASVRSVAAQAHRTLKPSAGVDAFGGPALAPRIARLQCCMVD